MLLFLIFDLLKSRSGDFSCDNSSILNNSRRIDLNEGSLREFENQVPNGKIDCFQFSAESGQELYLSSNTSLEVVFPDGSTSISQGIFRKILQETGEYTLRIDGTSSSRTYKIEVGLNDAYEASSDANNPVSNPKGNPVEEQISEVGFPTYNVKSQPSLTHNQELQQIVDGGVSLASDQGLPIQRLSITLINLNSLSFAAYNEQESFFPASVTKLFWLIALFGYYDADKLPQNSITEEDLYRMIQDSDNNAASRVLDSLTGTQSGSELNDEELKNWIEQREIVNSYFEGAGYSDINISQKNFPIPDLTLDTPTGRELQMRGGDEDFPIRNSLTSWSIARLLFEIEQGHAISQNYSQKAKQLLKRDFISEQAKEYDSIQGFLGGGLNPNEVTLFSKPGWTSFSRQDAAIIYGPNGSARYILVVLGDDIGYADDWEVFPQISEYIYSRMLNTR
ncbi:serine hydrolase [Sphaerothrix gracilis]|uniref:serine hydrolase n=1 Tax=Sphaerothrix gracilis TaxID=3151835 RepID=UPI0031FE15AA